jgi:poly(3-hydroxybutyrate) depolymerase
MRRMRRSLRIVAVLPVVAVSGVVLTACAPVAVVPSVPFSHGQFEGFDVISYVPDHPVAIAYVFHGSNGSAAFAEKVETVAVLNDLIGRGYGFVATDSTERTRNKRWNVSDQSLQTNPDLARLVRLHQHLTDTTSVQATTPIVGLGMSNGARFVTLFGQTWSDAGYPVRAVAPYMGRIAEPVEQSGGLTVPTFFVTAENDFTSPPGPIAANYAATSGAGTPAELHVAQEMNLRASRFLRIPGIDGGEAQAVFDALVDAGVWNPAGERAVTLDQAVALAPTVELPAPVANLRAEIVDQCALVLAVHQMRADFEVQMAGFFAEHL